MYRVLGLYALMCMTCVAHAQNLPPDDDFGDFEIQTQDTQARSGFWDILRQNVSVSAGAMNGTSASFTREMWNFDIGLDSELADGFKLVVLGRASGYNNEFTQTLRFPDDPRLLSDFNLSQDDLPAGIEPAFENCPPPPFDPQHCAQFYRGRDVLPNEQSVSLTGEDSYLNEAFFQWDATSFMTLRIGRQRLLWGQFNLLSPASITLPFASSGTTSRSTKADLAHPQDVVSVSLFPLDNLELALFHAPGMRLDPQTEAANRQYAQNNAEFLSRNFYQQGLPVNQSFQNAGDLPLSALRLLYFSSVFTFGLTLVDGYDTGLTFPYRDMRFARRGDITVPQEYLGEAGLAVGATAPFYRITEDKGVVYVPIESLAAELAVPLTSKWTAKAEFNRYDTLDPIDLPGNNPYRPAALELFAAIVSDERGANAGRLVKAQTITIGSMGAEFNGTDWVGQLQIININRADNESKIARLETAANTGAADEATQTVPLFSIARKLGANDEGYVGFGVGAFFQSIGGGFFAGWTLFESLEFGGFIGQAEGVEGEPESTELYQNDNTGMVAQFGINFRF